MNIEETELYRYLCPSLLIIDESIENKNNVKKFSDREIVTRDGTPVSNIWEKKVMTHSWKNKTKPEQNR